MSEITHIYKNYLLKLNKKHVESRYKGDETKFSASGAGNCFLKQWFKINGYERAEPDEVGMRKMRLGTILHDDIQTAILFSPVPNSQRILVEERIELPEINVIGHFDIAIVDLDAKRIEIKDIKTTHDYKWKLMFGRKKETNPNYFYEMQLATYTLGLLKEYKDYVASMYIYWYNKNTSMVRETLVNARFLPIAWEYWTNLNEFCNNITDPTSVTPGLDPEIPVAKWECNYCDFWQHCTTPLRTKK